MSFGVDKCGVMGFNLKEDEKLAFEGRNFTLHNLTVPHVEKYTYLGVTVNDNFGSANHAGVMDWAKERASKVDRALNLLRPYLRSRLVPIRLRVECFKVLVISVASYGGEFGGLVREPISFIQGRLNRGIKWILGSKSTNPSIDTRVMLVELAIPSLWEICAVARCRMWIKLSKMGYDRWGGILCQSIREPKQWTSQHKTWVTYTPWYVKTYLKYIANLEDGLCGERKITDFVEAIGTSLRKQEYVAVLRDGRTVSSTYYLNYGLEGTRSYLNHTPWIHDVALGVMWLVRLRLTSIRSAKALHGELVRVGKARAEDVPIRCIACKKRLGETQEWAHYLCECEGMDMKRI